MPSRRFVRRAAVAGAAVVAVAGGGTALAAGAAPAPNLYQGCLSAANGSLYSVALNPTSAPQCHAKDTAVTWNQTGPAGADGAQGPQGEQGPKGDTGPMPQLSTYIMQGTLVNSTATGVDSTTLTCNWPDTAISGGFESQYTSGMSGLWTVPWMITNDRVGGFTFGGWLGNGGAVSYQAYVICQKSS